MKKNYPTVSIGYKFPKKRKVLICFQLLCFSDIFFSKGDLVAYNKEIEFCLNPGEIGGTGGALQKYLICFKTLSQGFYIWYKTILVMYLSQFNILTNWGILVKLVITSSWQNRLWWWPLQFSWCSWVGQCPVSIVQRWIRTTPHPSGGDGNLIWNGFSFVLLIIIVIKP